MSDRDGKKTTTFLLSLKYGWYIKVVVIDASVAWVGK